MQYADSLRKVLIRKITRAERDLVQLKLDYCRFVFGISHRSMVRVDDVVYHVRSVDVNSMERLENGEFGKPDLAGVPRGQTDAGAASELVALGKDWVPVPPAEHPAC